MSGTLLAVGQWQHEWPRQDLAAFARSWLVLACLAMAFLGALLVAGWWRDRHSATAGPRGPGARTIDARTPWAGRPGATGRPSGSQLAPDPSIATAPVLASDPERDLAAGRLSQAIGDGRLDLDEGVARIDAVYRARYRSELAQLVSDLPEVSGEARAPRTPPIGRRRVLALSAVLVLAAVVVQGALGMWELWPLAVAVLAALATRAHR